MSNCGLSNIDNNIMRIKCIIEEVINTGILEYI